MSNPSRRGPRPLSDILGELFTVRGYGRLRARQELENAWNAAVGEPYCRQTRLGEVRRGVLDVTVAHSTLLEELAAFRKPALLTALRSDAPATTIRDIRFRVGTVAIEDKPARVAASRSSAVPLPRATRPPGFPARPQDSVQGGRSEPGNDSDPEPAQP
jgi:predicted nucleic acid-binding Zn ribbon protein